MLPKSTLPNLNLQRFPRLKIGLRHASVSQKQCDAWLSLVIFTICERSGMNSSRNLNRSAFCILSGIPNLWLSRAPELFVTLAQLTPLRVKLLEQGYVPYWSTKCWSRSQRLNTLKSAMRKRIKWVLDCKRGSYCHNYRSRAQRNI